MIREKIALNLNTGLQARPAYKLVNISNRYSSDVYIEMENKKVNCKSIMGIMSLGLAPNTEFTLLVDGYDEKELSKELSKFFKGE